MYLSGVWLGVDKSYTKMTCVEKLCATNHTLEGTWVENLTTL